MFTKKAVLFSVCAVVLSSVFLLCASCRAQQSSEEAFQNAILYSQKEEYDLAVKEINKAIEIKPTSAEYSFLAFLRLLQSEFDMAVAAADKALELDPANGQAYNNRGAAFQKKGDFDKAILDCNKAIEIIPDIPFPYKNRALAFFGKKEYDKSWEDVHKAESLGLTVDPAFLEELTRASGKQK